MCVCVCASYCVDMGVLMRVPLGVSVCVCASYCVDMGVLMRVPLGGSVCVCIILCRHGCAHEDTSRWQCVCVHHIVWTWVCS